MKNNFFKSVLIPFFSGALGTILVIGTCFNVPHIKEKILNIDSQTILTSTSQTRKF